jgi:hypothetical protein
VSADPHRVTAQHIHGLAAADRMRGGNSVLADTDDGLRYVNPAAVLVDDSTVRRILLTSTDLQEDAAASGATMSAFLRANAGRLAKELNDVLTETEEF